MNLILLQATQATRSLAAHFTWVDWLVVIGYLALTTILGGLLAGKQATIKDFFLGGRKLPWYAVSGSIIATEISAVTFVGVPAIMFAPAGNFTYLQLGVFGSIISRLLVAWIFLPAYYEREIYSPYDYMANRLGGATRTVTTCLFIVGGMLAQGARVFLTAMILDLVLGRAAFGGLSDLTGISTMSWSIILIGVIAVVWTLMGGITTVIWTDVILFGVFFVGALVGLSAVLWELPGSMWQSLVDICRLGYDTKEAGSSGKFTFFNFSLSPAEQFTIWTAVIASTWGGLGAYGTDQLLAQRMFCCKGVRQARLALISSSFGQIIPAMMLMVGLGLFAYYRQYPPTGEAAELIARDKDNVFPVFIIQVLPQGITGLLIAGIFAAAISSLDSILAALSQTTLSAFYLPWRARRKARQAGFPVITDQPSDPAPPPETGSAGEHADIESDRSIVLVSRLLVVFWGVILCLMAFVAAAAKSKFPEILNLALSMAGYAGGALLAGFMLAFLRLRIDSRGFIWSAPLSVLTVFALVWHQGWTHWVCWIAAAVMLATWLMFGLGGVSSGELAVRKPRAKPVLNRVTSTLVLVAGLAIMLSINYFGYSVDAVTGRNRTLAWPWFIPVGSTVAFVWGYLLARRPADAGVSRGFPVVA